MEIYCFVLQSQTAYGKLQACSDFYQFYDEFISVKLTELKPSLLQYSVEPVVLHFHQTFTGDPFYKAHSCSFILKWS